MARPVVLFIPILYIFVVFLVVGLFLLLLLNPTTVFDVVTYVITATDCDDHGSPSSSLVLFPFRRDGSTTIAIDITVAIVITITVRQMQHDGRLDDVM